jgi:hypothetical protein
MGRLVMRPHQKVERCTPAVRRPTLWSTPSPAPAETCHAWTGGSFRSFDRIWVRYNRRRSWSLPPVAQRSSCLGRRQAVFNAELSGIRAALTWHLQGSYKHMVIHSDSTSAIARAESLRNGSRSEDCPRYPEERQSSRCNVPLRPDRVGERTLRHPRQREGRRASGTRGGESCLQHDGAHQSTLSGSASEKRTTAGCATASGRINTG